MLKGKNPLNPLIGYLNINSLRNKILHLREICQKCPIEILCIDETKLDSSFPDQQFKIEGYQFPPYRRDRNAHGGGKLVFIRQSLIVKRLQDLELEEHESICIELTISNTKWCLLFVYRPPNERNKVCFFNELTTILNKIAKKYENFLLTGDMNIDYKVQCLDFKNILSDFCDAFCLTNLVNSKTCFKSREGTSLDVMLTNNPNKFQNTTAITTGLSDFHSLIVTSLCSTYQRLSPKTIYYRNYKSFKTEEFLHDLDQNLLNGNIYSDKTKSYSKLTEIFSATLEEHAPLKRKIIRGNHAPFMTKALSKAIMDRSRLKNKYQKWPSRENFLRFKKAKNCCNKLNKQAKKDYFKNASKDGVVSNKKFWDTVKPFLTNKGSNTNDSIVIEQNNKLITDDRQLTELFNSHYINIVEKSSGNKPSSIGFPENSLNDELTVSKIIDKYKDHPSIKAISRNFLNNNQSFYLPEATVPEINKIIKNLNTKKANGPDKIPLKVIKLSASIIDSYLTNIVNNDIEVCSFSEEAKTATVRPIYKKKSRTVLENYRPVSLLNGFSKIYERYLHEKLMVYLDDIISKFVSAYRKTYSSSHVLIRLIESWKNALDIGKVSGAVLMDLSKAFDCIPHDLLIAKLHAYGIKPSALTFFYSYLKRRKQNVTINNTSSTFQFILSGVPQGSILGPILFNVFINDLFFFLNKSDLHNFADDNTISAVATNIKELLTNLEKESKIAVNWFEDNNMIVNPDKFQAIILKKENNPSVPYVINVGKAQIKSETSVNLLGIEIDQKLCFDKHISTLCKKAAGQLNAIGRISNYLDQKGKEAIINGFVYANFNYCPLVWHFCSAKSVKKIEKIQERLLRLLLNDYRSDYKSLLVKSSKSTMEVKRLRALALEIFRTLNNMNPEYLKDIFIQNTTSVRNYNNLVVHSHRTATYGDKSLSTLGPKIWNSLPNNIKSLESFSKFKSYIDTWFGPKCSCSICKFNS